MRTMRTKYVIVLSLILLLLQPSPVGAAAVQDPVSRWGGAQIWPLNAVRLNNGNIMLAKIVQGAGQPALSYTQVGVAPFSPQGTSAIAHRASTDTVITLNASGTWSGPVTFSEHTAAGALVRQGVSQHHVQGGGALLFPVLAVLGNGDLVYCICRDMLARFDSTGVCRGQSARWSHFDPAELGAGIHRRINTLLPLGGNVLAAGDGGRWQMFHSNNSWGLSGTIPSGSTINHSLQRPDGTILLLGDHITVYNSAMTSILHSAAAPFQVLAAALLNNGYVFLGSFHGQYAILRPNNTFTPTTTLTFYAGTTNHIKVAVPSADGLSLMVFADEQSWPTVGGFRRCLFLVNPTITGQTQTSISLSWTPSTPGPWNYQIEKRIGAGAWTLAHTLSGTSHTVTGLLPGTHYDFRIRATLDGVLTFPFSSIIGTLTLPPTPAPTGESGGLAWHSTEGRGFVRLTWPAVTGATGYAVWVFDGQAWRRFDIGNRLHWDSREELIYPTEAQIASFPPGTRTADIFNRARLGLNLRDTPINLYRSAHLPGHHNDNHYHFGVTAYNASGEGPQSAAFTPTLPNRTDGALPQVSTAIVNSGESTTFSRNVTLQFDATDALSGAETVQVSNDGFLTHQAIPFTGPATVSWQLTPGEGTKTVSVRAVDHAGNLSPVVAATIALVADRLAPQVHLTVNNGAATTESQTATLFINAYDNVTPVSQLQMRVSNDGTNWMHLNNNVWTAGSGWGPYAARPPVWMLTPGGGEKTIFVQVRDSDGNIGIASRFIVLVDGTNRPTANVTLAATATAGSAPNLNGQIVNIGGHLMQVVQGNTVSLQLDNLQGATHILISHDGALWSAPEALPAGATSVARLLTFPGEGTRAVHIRLRNKFGVESLPVVFRFLVDHTPPSVRVTTQNNATATRTASIGLRVTGTDNLSQRLFFSIGAAPFAELPATGLISAPVVMGLNEINIRIIDEAGNIAPAVARVWRL